MAYAPEYNSEAPDVTADRIKSDFEAIFERNMVEVEVKRQTDPQAGDYFHEGESPGWTSFKIWMCTQGETSDKYAREKYGITTVGAVHKAYARHFEDLQNLDQVYWNGIKFIMKDLNKSIHNGIVCFQSFDLVRVDKAGG